MPFIRVTTSAEMTPDREKCLREKLAQAVGDILQKNPERMMTAFEGSMAMCRGGNENRHLPAAFVECKFFGGPDYSVFQVFDRRLQQIFGEILDIAPGNLYIKYEVINGWNEPPRLFKI